MTDGEPSPEKSTKKALKSSASKIRTTASAALLWKHKSISACDPSVRRGLKTNRVMNVRHCRRKEEKI